MPRALDLHGQQFGRLTVISCHGSDNQGARRWLCRCSCGNEKSLRGADLKRGFIKSCGCWKSDAPKLYRTTHGGSATRLYRIWQAIHDRTENPGASRYVYYGGRGIAVCPEWQTFAKFREWAISAGYRDPLPNEPRSKHLTIDRIDVDGNYDPTNCRWVVQREQVLNRRKKMKVLSFEKVAAQGELTITRLAKRPKNIGTPVEPKDGKLIVGHSESGHNHITYADCATLTRVDEFTAYLDVKKPTELVHLREYDTHPSIALQPGMYEFRTGREFDPFEDVIRASQD